MNLPLLNKVNADSRVQFGKKVIDVGNKLDFSPALIGGLMAVMYLESGFDPSKVNHKSGATGLLQFMPSTAKKMGTSVEALRSMTNVQQMDYVYKYLLPLKGKITTYPELYMAVFFPSAIGKPDYHVIQTKDLSADTIAKANKIFDLHGDNRITVGEIKEVLWSKTPKSIRDFLKTAAGSAALPIAIGTVILLILIFR